jgi:hypothetical protein
LLELLGKRKVADEIGGEERANVAVLQKPMERNIRKMILMGNQRTFRRVCFKIIQSHSRKYQPSR